MVRVYENRCRRATAADFLKHSAVGHLRKTASTVFHWRGRSEHADATESIDNLARNIRLSIYLNRIEMFIEKLPKFRQRLVQLGLLRCWDAWIRHHPIGNETTLEKTFRQAKRLWPREEELLRLLNLLLPLRSDFVHEKFAAENGGHALSRTRPSCPLRGMRPTPNKLEVQMPKRNINRPAAQYPTRG